MKKVFTVATSFALSSVLMVGESEAARHRFWGGIVFTGVVGTCADDNTNEQAGIRFTPAITGDAKNASLSIFKTNNARNYEVNGKITSVFKAATETNIFDFASKTSTAVSIRFITQSPASTTAATVNIVATGEIKGYDAQPQCTVKFRLTATKRVES